MRFVVVGGGGFIGSYLVEVLLRAGDEVLVIDSFANSVPINLPQHARLRVLKQDILAEPCTIEDQFGTEVIDGLAHLAAIPSVQASWQSLVSSHQNNLSTTVAAVQLCQRWQIPRLIFTSSAAVYGDQRQLPIGETQPLKPMTPYGLQKLMGEQYLKLFAEKFGFSAIALRLFNVFGPRQAANSPYSGVISTFTQRMFAGLPITVYGDGAQSRDFIYVQDVAGALAKALKISARVGSFTVCNLGTQSQVSLLELIQILQELIPDWTQVVHFSAPRLGDIQHSQANIQRAVEILDWRPRWPVKEGLAELLNHLSFSSKDIPLINNYGISID
ncbi:MAG: NAD-dependent epimerase/dehydratase family protein [Cyanobacteria bacterium P01_H01_bin.119]